MEKNNDQKKETKPQEVQSDLAMVNKIEKVFNKFIERENVKNFLVKMVYNLDFTIDYMVNNESVKYERNPVLQTARSPVRFGMLVVGIFLLTFGSWSVFAPIVEGSHAMGTIVSSSNRQAVQHLEGGTIREIYVKDGDHVQAGDKLLLIERVDTNGEYKFSRETYYHNLANLARLMAEKDALDKVDYPKEILDNLSDSNIKTIYDNQEKLFQTTMQNYLEQNQVYEAAIESAKKNIESFSARATSSQKQMVIITDRLDSTKKLAEQGYASKAALADMERNFSLIQGELGDYENKVLSSKQDLIQTQSKYLAFKSEFANKIAGQIQESKAKLSQSEASYVTTKDKQERQLITAPIEGIVHNFFYVVNAKVEHYGPGSIIGQGTSVMEIAPIGEDFEVEAKVDPNDIDAVHEGMEAKMHLSAFKMKYPPDILGKVTYVSTDLLKDNSQNGQVFTPYYAVKIKIDNKQFTDNPDLKGMKLQAGMGLDVTIISGYKPFIRYLLDPLRKNFKKAFNER